MFSVVLFLCISNTIFYEDWKNHNKHYHWQVKIIYEAVRILATVFLYIFLSFTLLKTLLLFFCKILNNHSTFQPNTLFFNLKIKEFVLLFCEGSITIKNVPSYAWSLHTFLPRMWKWPYISLSCSLFSKLKFPLFFPIFI